MESPTEPSTSLLFSYGGNMSTLCIELNNIRAEFVAVARLDNHRLDFIRYSKFWGGPQATVVLTANAHVWGVIWRVNKDDMEIIDKQEEIYLKKQYVNYIEVNTTHMGTFLCRIYIQRVSPLPRGDKDDIPVERWPSRIYKKIMIHGAIEHKLPDYYINSLRDLKDNGDIGCFRMYSLLKTYATKEPCKCPYVPPPPRPRILRMKKLKSKNIECCINEISCLK